MKAFHFVVHLTGKEVLHIFLNYFSCCCIYHMEQTGIEESIAIFFFFFLFFFFNVIPVQNCGVVYYFFNCYNLLIQIFHAYFSHFIFWQDEDVGDEYNENNFYESDEEQKEKDRKVKKTYTMDPDHRLLLRNTKPLLQSRNAAV